MAIFCSQKRFERLFLRHGDDLWRFAHFLESSRHDAEGAMQQTWLPAREYFPGLPNTGKTKAWLFTILYRELSRQHRDDGRNVYQEIERKFPDSRPVQPALQNVAFEGALRRTIQAPMNQSIPGRLPVDESHVAARYIHGMTVIVVPSSPLQPRQLLAGLNPMLYPL